jgi:UDP-2-acetamido-2-deoxy-ribo-hexuluronate aminotransferase
MEFIDLKKQYQVYKSEIDERMAKVMAHGRFIMGPEIAELEAELSAFVGVKHALTVASGTDSLEIALRALEIGPGDEVVTVPFTWISTAEAVALVGAKPVFVDIDPETFNLDPAALEAAITGKTKAIMPVSLYGHIAEMSAINTIADKHGLPVVEDAAQSFGATQGGRRSGGMSTIGSTSFFPAKVFGCYGDGGALFTDDDAMAERMRAIRTHGAIKRHHHPFVGMNGRFDTLQAAVLLAKFPHFETELVARSRIGARYSELLSGLCPTPVVLDDNTHAYAQYTLRVPDRGSFQADLKEAGIPTAIHYPKCLHEQPVFEDLGYKMGDFPHSEKAAQEVISLPMHPFLDEAAQDEIVAAVKAALGR